MKEILIFAGTTEGRELSERLTAIGVGHRICVATEYGEIVLKPNPLVKVLRGPMGQEDIRELLWKSDFAAVVDATHPYAEMITQNIKGAMEGMDIPRLRIIRERDECQGQAAYFDSNRECAGALESIKGNILLTTGSKELEEYCTSEDMKSRLYVRVLPAVESISRCMEQGIRGNQIIAMQGPFTVEMNEAVIRQYNISCLVTKDSGKPGGFGGKLEAAKRTGAKVYVIGRPQMEEEGLTFSEAWRTLEEICGKKAGQAGIPRPGNPADGSLEIILAGAGMGDRNCLTGEVREAIDTADVLLGAKRLLARYGDRMEKHPFYQAEQVIPYLKKTCGKKVVILFSGDSGFYSGCTSLYTALEREIQERRLKASLRIMPGISLFAFSS